jgi:hypothetical protein
MNALNPFGDVALTPAGTAYAEAHSRPAIEARIETLLDMVMALTALLDDADGDPDAEPTMGWAWREPIDGYAPGGLDGCEPEEDKAIDDDPHDHGDDDEVGGAWHFACHISGGGSGI